jgi:hypothetical protein
MDIDPMQTQMQRNRWELETVRYPFLMIELIRRKPDFCKRMTEEWQETVLDPLNELMIPARLQRPIAFINFGHWGPWGHVYEWRVLVAARFTNEAGMISWLIASQHMVGDFLHSQCCILGIFCHCLRESIPTLPSKRKQLLWTKMLDVLQCMICKESRFEWGQATTRFYIGFFLDRVCECLDFASFVLASNLKDLTRTQVLPMTEFCTTIRRTVLDKQLLQLMPDLEWI